MRRTTRLLASAKPQRFLEPYVPTGLCGLMNHPTPRPTLIYLYNSTLEKLKDLPTSSLYRQSTEALTKHRLKIVESVIPVGFEEWSVKSQKIIKEFPQFFDPKHPDYVQGKYKTVQSNGKEFVRVDDKEDPAEVNMEWDGESDFTVPEGSRSEQERAFQSTIGEKMTDGEILAESGGRIKWEPEPPLDVDQISDIEHQIGAGLIEEVIEVAEGELKLVDTMAESKVWEDLQEKPVEGQWTYFTRDTNTPTTQSPPK